MKVLLLQKMAGISGSERYFLAILPELHRRGLDVSFLVVQHPANYDKNIEFIRLLRKSSIPVHVIESRFGLSPLLLWRLARLIRKYSFDILHTNLIHADVWGAIIRRLSLQRVRLVSVKHGYSESYQTSHGLDPSFVKADMMTVATRFAAASADRVVCISRALEEFLVGSRLVDPGKVLTIPYGFDFSGVSPQTDPGSLRVGQPQIIVAGRLVPVKQHHLLLEILPDLIRTFPDVCVVMVGAGPLLETLRARADELGVASYVRWEGFRTNMHDYIRDSDLMVVPSAAEGFGLVVLEAWFHAKPVIAFDVAALNEVVENGVDGILVTPFDSTKLLEAVGSLLSDPSRMRKMGESGQAKQARLYGINAMAERTMAVYSQVVADASIRVG